MKFARSIGIALVLALAATACGRKTADEADVNALDQALAGNSANDADPALTSALADQIMVDPALAQSSNRNAIRPPDGPATSPIPPDAGPGGPQTDFAAGTLHAPAPTASEAAADDGTTLGALASAQRTGVGAWRGRCVHKLAFSTGYAAKLPAAFPVYPGGRVSEGAGDDQPGCALRIVSFASDAPLQTVLDWYYTRAVQGGYTAAHETQGDDHILAGTRSRDDSAYYLSFAAMDGGTQIDLIATAN